MMKKDLLIIIPAYNESATIGRIIKELSEQNITEYADLLIMNDGSEDPTSHIAKTMGVVVLSQVFNLGYGTALQLGYKFALRHGYDYVIQMDADGQHDICNIDRIYKELKRECEDKPDIIISSRFLDGSVSFPISGVKKLAIAYFRGLIGLLTHHRITDPTSGLQGLTKKAFLYYSKYNCFESRYPDANIIIKMLRMGFNIKEIPSVMHERTEGVSMHSNIFSAIGYMVLVTVSIFAVVLRSHSHRESKNDILVYDNK